MSTTDKGKKDNAGRKEESLRDLGRRAVEMAKKHGAKEASASVTRQREVSVTWRDGKLEKMQEATTRSLGMRLYVDGRFSGVSTSDLRPEAIDAFLKNAVVMTRALAEDPFRSLPDPSLYQGQAAADLEIEDAGYEGVTAVSRRELASAIEAASRKGPGSDAILSVTADVSDTWSEMHLVTSNGFEGARRETQFWAGAAVSVKDKDGRRPEDYHFTGTRRVGELPKAADIGAEANRRAMERLGSKKGASAELLVIVENRAAGRLANFLAQPMSGQALQQKRSFLDGKQGQKIWSPLLDITDDPLLPRGLGSRLFDSEGLAAKRLPIISAGTLSNYYLDTYYAKKLKVTPTTARPSNLSWKLGDKSLAQLIAGTKDALLVTGFIGGNSNSATGDFSVGVTGVRIRNGALAESVSEMNLAGNHLEFWKRLVAVGNDPYPYSPMRTPTLVFEKVSIAGT